MHFLLLLIFIFIPSSVLIQNDPRIQFLAQINHQASEIERIYEGNKLLIDFLIKANKYTVTSTPVSTNINLPHLYVYRQPPLNIMIKNIWREFEEVSHDFFCFLQDRCPPSKELLVIAKKYSDWAIRFTYARYPHRLGYLYLSTKSILGTYYISQIEDENLVSMLQDKIDDKLYEALVVICTNTMWSKSYCRSELNQAIEKRKNDIQAMVKFKDKYWQTALQIWKSRFEIEKLDIPIEIKGNKITVWFRYIDDLKMRDFIKQSIESQFSIGKVQFIVEFSKKKGFEVEYALDQVAYALPNEGKMFLSSQKQNQLEKLIVAHEFGHLLGFPDCYIEYIEAETLEQVYYTLDYSNLMCSLDGKIKQQHIDEIFRVYGKRN